MKLFIKIIVLAVAQFYCSAVSAQTTQKKIDHNTHSWISINSNLYLNKKWFIMADAHLRENGFFASNSFMMGRVGLGYQLSKELTFVAGYANLLSSPTTAGWTTKSDENRIFEQLQLTTTYNKIKVLQRLRNEQRWQQIIANDKATGALRFTNRVRYLVSATFQLFKNPSLPQVALADECMIQFGKDVVYNTFEQNRVFVGIKQKINNNLSFDMGYMNLFQQKSNGISYNENDTYRLFFYYTLPPHKTKKAA